MILKNYGQTKRRASGREWREFVVVVVLLFEQQLKEALCRLLRIEDEDGCGWVLVGDGCVYANPTKIQAKAFRTLIFARPRKAKKRVLYQKLITFGFYFNSLAINSNLSIVSFNLHLMIFNQFVAQFNVCCSLSV